MDGEDRGGRLAGGGGFFRNSKCLACDSLEGEYQCAIHEIFSVVRTRFPTLRQKLRELHQWHDLPDGRSSVLQTQGIAHSQSGLICAAWRPSVMATFLYRID